MISANTPLCTFFSTTWHLQLKRPDTTRVWESVDNFRETGVGENWTTSCSGSKPMGTWVWAAESCSTGSRRQTTSPTAQLQLVGGSEQYPYFPVYRSRDAYANDVILIDYFIFLIKILARRVLYFNTVKKIFLLSFLYLYFLTGI